MTFRAQLFDYDYSKDFGQIFNRLGQLSFVAVEFRFSPYLWKFFCSGHDQVFNLTVDPITDTTLIEQGFVGTAFGVKLTTEWVIVHRTQMAPLPDNTYIGMYDINRPFPRTTQISTSSPNLLELAQQIIGP